MDETVLKNLLAALETIYNISVTNEQRQKAQEYCELLKNEVSGPVYGYYLAHKDNQQPDVVRYFGLDLIESTVRYRWPDASLSSEAKAQIRLNVMALAAEGGKPLLVEQTFIKEKVARLFVEVAKREWPGAWDDMDAFLRQLFNKDESSREMSLLILRSLCEDVCLYDDAVASLRKKDLRAGLLIIMASEAILKEQYPDGVKGHHNEVTLMVGERGNDGWLSRLTVMLMEVLPRCQTGTPSPADEKIGVAGLKFLSSTLDWVIMASFSAVPIMQLICQAVQSPTEKIRLAAAECYDVLSSRNMSDAEREKIIWPLLDGGGVDLIASAYNTYSTQIVQGDSYLFIQKMVQATVNLGELQLCAKRSAHIPRELAKFLYLLYSMASHPSVLISSIVSYFWVTLIRHDTFSKDPTVQSYVPRLLELYSGHLAKDYENRRRSDQVYDHFASIDFDSATEFRARAGQTFQMAVNVIHLGVPLVPIDALAWVAGRVTLALNLTLPAGPNVKDTPQFETFDGTFTLMEVAISSLTEIISDKSDPLAGPVLEAMNTQLSVLIDFNATCPAALDRVVSSLSVFTDMFKLNSNLLFQCLDKLFKTVEYPLPDQGAHDIRELRRRAAITLVKIGRVIPNTLFPIYGEIENAVQRLIQQNIISMGERKTLMCFLLVVGFNSDNIVERRRIFEKVVLPVALDFQSADLQDALSTPQKFLAFIGAQELSMVSSKSLQPNEAVQIREAIIQRRSRLSWSVETLMTFMKETVDPRDSQRAELWTSCLGPMLPNLMSTIRCLNAICDSAQWKDLSPEMERILTFTAEEKEMLVTGKALAPTASSAPTVVKMIGDLKIWLSLLRENSYKFLAQMSALGSPFYSIPSLPVVLEEALFGNVDFLTNRQLRFLINSAVLPIVVNCPPDHMQQVLSHLLGVLFPYLDRRLQNDWKKASDEGLVMDEKDDPVDLDVSDVILNEVMLRDVTRSVSEFAFAILDSSKIKSTGTGSQVKESTPLAIFLLSSEYISATLIPLICRIMVFKDTRACIRSVETSLNVLGTLVQNYPGTHSIIQAFSAMVLQAALEALNDPYHQEGQDKLILLITEVYVEVRPLDQAPKLAFQQIPGVNFTQLEAFELGLSAATNRTKKHALVRNFLQGIIGVAKSEWFKQRSLGEKATPSRTITGKYERPSLSVLDSAHEEDIGDGLASLFDE